MRSNSRKKTIPTMLLENKILAITRNEHDAKEFIQLVTEQGGRAIALPTIEIVPKGLQAVKEFVDKLRKEKHEYCAFMSSQAVRVLFDVAATADRDEVLAALNLATTVIAVGPKTKQSLERHWVNVALMPERFSSEGLVELLSRMKPKGKKIIIPRSGSANEFAADALMRLGMHVDEVLLYTVRTCTPTLEWEEFARLLSQKRVDAIIFTSASSVNSFFEILDKVSHPNAASSPSSATGVTTTAATITAASAASTSQRRHDQYRYHHYASLDTVTRVVSIGPFTSKELKKRNIKCFEAEEHTVYGAFKLAQRLVLSNSF